MSIIFFAGLHHFKQEKKLQTASLKAESILTSGNWKEAAISYKQLLAMRAKDVSFKNSLMVCQYMIEAEAAENEDKLNEALAYCQNARQIEKSSVIIALINSKIDNVAKRKNAKIISLLSNIQILKNKGDLEKSLSCLMELFTIDPNNTQAQQLHSELTTLLEKQESEKQKAAKISSLFAEVLSFKNNKEFNKSLEYITQILTLTPDNPEAKQLQAELTLLIEQKKITKLIEKATNYESQEDWEKAIEIYNQATAIKPNDNNIKNELAGCQHDLYLSKAEESENKGDLDNAVKLYTKALSYKHVETTQIKLDSVKTVLFTKLEARRKQQEYDLCIKKAKAYENKGNLPTAAEFYIKAQEYTDDSYQSKISSLYQQITKQDKKNKFESLLAKARAHYNRENNKVPLAILEELLELAPKHIAAKQLVQKISACSTTRDPGWWLKKAPATAIEINYDPYRDSIEIAEIQAGFGDKVSAQKTLKQAKVITSTISSTKKLWRKSDAYITIANTQMTIGESQAALKTLQDAKNIVDKRGPIIFIPDSSKLNMPHDYGLIAKLQAKAGDVGGATETFGFAKDAAVKLGRLKPYLSVAKFQVEAGYITAAKETFRLAKRKADTYNSKEAYGYIVEAYAEIGNIDQANMLAKNLGTLNTRWSDHAYSKIAGVLAEKGSIHDAKTTAAKIRGDNDEKKRAYLEIAKAQIKAWDLNGAKITAANLSFPENRADVYNDMVMGSNLLQI